MSARGHEVLAAGEIGLGTRSLVDDRRPDLGDAELLYDDAPYGVGLLRRRLDMTPLRVLAIVGPTATGKSDLAVALRQRLGRRR